MLVRYRLPVTGHLRLEFSFPVRTALFTYAFEVDDDGVVTHLNATASVPDKALWPQVAPDPQPGVKAHIQMSSPYFPLLRRDIRGAAGILALFGVDEISADDSEEIWEAENPEEKAALAVYSIKRSRDATPRETWPRISFDLVARALLVAERATDFEAALNFFRKGRLDMKSEQFLDAVLDFLFMVETTYANGRFKTAQVEAEYLASQELRGLISDALRDPVLRANVRDHSQIEQSFRQTYEGKSPEAVINHLVRLRGELHHHTSRKSGVWHPTDHVRFGADAYFLQHLCLGIAFAVANPTLFAESAVHTYQAQAHSSAASGLLKVYRK
jgi:hypothetical protein